ncbi:MAG: hypothetical protein V4564_09760 [Pseudomonadota bacterium]
MRLRSQLVSIVRCAMPVACIAMAWSLSGCSADIMRGYIGRSPEAVMARYGPPVDVRDLPDGRRAYQWMEAETTTSGGEAVTKEGRRGSRTEFSPTTTSEKRCFYTMYAHRAADGWRIDDYAKPEFGC